METKYEVGQKVYVGRVSGSFGPVRFQAGTVKNITPKGMVDVEFGIIGGTVKRFSPNGREAGATLGLQHYLDTLTFEARTASISSEARAQTAANAIREVVKDHGRSARAEWGKEGLAEEVTRLRKLLDAAWEAVEAI